MALGGVTPAPRVEFDHINENFGFTWPRDVRAFEEESLLRCSSPGASAKLSLMSMRTLATLALATGTLFGCEKGSTTVEPVAAAPPKDAHACDKASTALITALQSGDFEGLSKKTSDPSRVDGSPLYLQEPMRSAALGRSRRPSKL